MRVSANERPGPFREVEIANKSLFNPSGQFPDGFCEQEQQKTGSCGEEGDAFEELRQRQRLDESRDPSSQQVAKSTSHEPDAHHLTYKARR